MNERKGETEREREREKMKLVNDRKEGYKKELIFNSLLRN
jgi:hypothetical protein